MSSLEVRERLVEALRLDLVGPWAEHAFSDERLPGWVRPSNWYLTGFLIPAGNPAATAGDDDEDDDMGSEVPEQAGLAEESSEERKAAKKGFFPTSMGLSFLVAGRSPAITVAVRWGEYVPAELPAEDGKALPVWQRIARAETVTIALTGISDEVVRSSWTAQEVSCTPRPSSPTWIPSWSRQRT